MTADRDERPLRSSPIDRRTLIVAGGAAAAGAWVAPQIISASAAAAATAPPLPPARMVAVGAGGRGILTPSSSPTEAGDWGILGPLGTDDLFGVTNRSAGPPRWVTVGVGGAIFTAGPDALTWTPSPSGVADDLRAVATTGATFVAVGARGAIVTSADGLAWTVVRAPADGAPTLRGVAASASTVVAVGDLGTILSADPTDLTTWTTEPSPLVAPLEAVAVNSAGTFVAVGLPAVAPTDSTILLRDAGTGTWSAGSTSSPGTPYALHAVAVNPVSGLAAAAGTDHFVWNGTAPGYGTPFATGTLGGVTIRGMTGRTTSPQLFYVGTGGSIFYNDTGNVLNNAPSPVGVTLFAVSST